MRGFPGSAPTGMKMYFSQEMSVMALQETRLPIDLYRYIKVVW
jgi:hypothetical protein